MSVKLHGKDAQEKGVIIDTTVQEKNATYPTDGKLTIKIREYMKMYNTQNALGT